MENIGYSEDTSFFRYGYEMLPDVSDDSDREAILSDELYNFKHSDTWRLKCGDWPIF